MRHIFEKGGSPAADRLEQLIEERTRAGADKKAIDARIWELFGGYRAVMFTDLSGFSRRSAEFGIVHFLQVIYESARLLEPVINRHDGLLLKLEGDSMLVVFRGAARALECAIDMQRTLKAYNKDKSDVEAVLLGIGLGYGQVLCIGDHDVFGAEVNAASKLGEDSARPWEILATDAVKNEVGEVPGVRFDPCDLVAPGADAVFRVAYSI